MITRRTLPFALLLAAAFISETARGQTIVSDNYTAANVNSGFALGEGINSGVNPPTSTRMTGSITNLRYYQTATAKPTSQYDINANRLRVVADATSAIGRFTISANGTSPFDFGTVLGATYASATNKATYDVTISMRNNASTAARFSFALATVEGDTSVWDFGVQLYRAVNTDDFYTIQKRIDSNSSGNASDMNAVLTNAMSGTWVSGSQATINFLIRVTDAGAESGANYNSRIQVSTNAGAGWIYDTATDSALPNGFRFDGTARVIIFDQAGNTSGNVFYDNFSIVSTYAPAPPASRIWNGGGTDDNWSTANNWGGSAVGNGSPLVFDGVTRQANMNDFAGLVVPSITFNNGGFLLGGNSVSNSISISNLAGINTLGLELMWDTTSAKTWSVASGSELVLNNVNTIEVNGDHNVYGGGTIRLKNAMNIGQSGTANPPINLQEGKLILDGGTLTTRGGYRIGSLASGAAAQTIITNNGALTITATSGNLRVGDSANPQGARLDIDSGLVSLSGTAVFAIGYATGSTGTVNQTGGLISVPIVSFSESGASSVIYTNKNGALLTGQIRKNNVNGSGAIYFDNAVLSTVPGAVEATFFTGLNTAQIGAGGLTLDVNTPVTIAQALSGPGALVKSNFGAATLTGANTYAGNTVVQDGKLVLPTTQTNAAAIQVADGKEFGVIVRNPGTTLAAGSLAFLGGSFATLTFDLSTFTTPTAPLIRVPSVSFNSPITVNVVNGNQLGVGQIKLVDYDGSIGGLGFSGAFTTDPILPPGVFGYLSNNVATTSIDLVITGVPGLRWTGATNGDWDYGTVNWFDKQNSVAGTYTDNQPLEFLDGAANTDINVTIAPSTPSIVVSNTTLPYVWRDGTINVTALKKTGAGSLTRITSNADTIGSIELNAGALITSIPLDIDFITPLTDNAPATGSFVKSNINTMMISAANTTYDGSFVVQQGILLLNSTSALGTTNGGTTIAAGGTLDLNNIIFPHEPVTVQGSGAGGVGAIIDSTTGGGVANNLTDVTMTGDTALGAPNGGRWDIRVRTASGPGPGLKGNGFNLTKVGSGFVSIACQRNLGAATPYWQMNLGDILVSEGTIAFAESLNLGNPAKALTVAPNATLQFFDMGFTNPITRNITMTDARLNLDGGSTDTNVFNGAFTLTGAITVNANQSISFFNGALTGGGSLNIFSTSPGRIMLNGVNTFAGDTTVTNGTLGGTGSLAGNLVMLAGTNAPGMGVGTFTVNGAATLGGTTLMELNRNLSPNSDRLVVGGALNFGGILQVVLGAGAPAPQGGNVYQLFNKAGSGSFSSISLPNLSGGLTWDTSNLAVNGSISVIDPNAKPAITNVAVVGGNFVFSGTGGTAGNPYIIYSTTNLTVPLANWTPVTTNTFGVGGTFSVTTAFSPSVPASFYRLFMP